MILGHGIRLPVDLVISGVLVGRQLPRRLLVGRGEDAVAFDQEIFTLLERNGQGVA